MAVAEFCDLDTIEAYRWPAGAQVLAPPRIGVRILSQPGAAVVSIPFHRAAKGIERSYRFFDPATADPRLYAGDAKATHVAVCAWHGKPLAELGRQLPFATALMEGRPPDWLSECRLPADAVLRVYRLASQPAEACPTIVPNG